MNVMLLGLFLSYFSNAEGVYSLQNYLESVKTTNKDARALVLQIEASEVKVQRAALSLSPQIFAEYNAFDDRTPPVFPFTPTRKEGDIFKIGIEKQTTLGLEGKLYFENSRNTLYGLNPAFNIPPSYSQARAVLELRQSLWNNSFGEKVRADLKADVAEAQSLLESQKFQLKQILLNAENTYWAMVTLNQIMTLQQENVARAKKLSEWMSKQGRMKLSDDVDVLQAKAAYEMRSMELETSRSDRNAMARTFNLLRGTENAEVENLQDLPPFKMDDYKNLLSKKIQREDYKSNKLKAFEMENRALSGRSSLKAKVDLVGTVASNGLDPQFAGAYNELKDYQYPSWTVGLQVRFPLNVSLTQKMKRAVKNDIAAAQESGQNVDFLLEKEWQDVVEKQKEYFDLFVRSRDIEKSYNTIVEKERRRLQNGRSTTFTLLNLEQTLVTSQIQRAKAQLALLQIQNMLKTFEAKNESI